MDKQEQIKEERKLSPALKDKYELVGIVPGVVCFPKHGAVDFCTISLDKADELFKDGCRYLKKIEPNTPAKASK